MKRLLLVIFALTFALAATAQNKVRHNVFLRSDAGEDTLWDGRIIRIYGLASRLTEEPHIPAKTLYCREGDTVSLRTLNISQGDHHTIHLHGLDVDTKNDGDPATSFSLGHMQDTDYTFYAAHAGTYLYHCHVADVVHVQMGMYGLIVVLAKDGAKTAWTGGPAFDKSYNWILSEIDHTWHDNIPKHDTTTDMVQLPLYQPDYFLVNGRSEPSVMDDSTAVQANQGQTVYLRLGSIGFFYQRIVFPSWMNARKVDSDGRPLPSAIAGDTIEIAPGERYGVLLDATQATLDSILIEYVNMNTDSVWGRQFVQVNTLQSGVSDVQTGNYVSIFPNPAQNNITVISDLEISERAEIAVFDALGKEVYHNSLETFPESIDLSNVPAGIYSIIIRMGNKKPILNTFILTR